MLEKLPVVYLRDTTEGGIFAWFPTQVANLEGDRTVYAPGEGHGAATRAYIEQHTTFATDAEAADLRSDLDAHYARDGIELTDVDWHQWEVWNRDGELVEVYDSREAANAAALPDDALVPVSGGHGPQGEDMIYGPRFAPTMLAQRAGDDS